MKKYYLYNGLQQQGPFLETELKQLHILPGTLIWTEGMDTWREAKEIPELADMITIPPPVPINAGNKNLHERASPQPVKRSIASFILIVSLIILLLAALGLFYFTGRSGGPQISTAEVAPIDDTAVVLPQSAVEPPRLTAEEQAKTSEVSRPGNYLIIHTTIEKNLVLQSVIKGTIFNKATVTTYDHIRLKIAYSDKNGELLGEEYMTIEGVLKPKGIIDIRHKPAKRTYRKAAGYTVSLSNVHSVN